MGKPVHTVSGRNYLPSLSQWLSIDPMAKERYWLSPYNYVQNSPFMRVDPSGRLDKGFWPWLIFMRSFIATSSTGGGYFYGDGRGFSTSDKVTSRVVSSFLVDPSNNSIAVGKPVSDPTIFYGMWHFGLPLFSPDIESGNPDSYGYLEKTFYGYLLARFGHSGKDPITPQFATPALDLHSRLILKEDLSNGILSISGDVVGDNFPSHELFIQDQSGARLMLGGSMEKGGLHSLFGDNQNALFKIDMQVHFNQSGNFTGVTSGGLFHKVEDWNKIKSQP